MYRDPIGVLDDGGYEPYGAQSIVEALRYALDPDVDGVVRAEPSSGVLKLSYGGASSVREIAVYLRGAGEVFFTEVPYKLQLRSGGVLLQEWSGALSLSLSTAVYVYSSDVLRSFSDLQVWFWTTDVVPTERERNPYFSQLTMLVLSFDVEEVPFIRRVRLVPAMGGLAPLWWLVVETNDPAPVSVPVGFRLVASGDLLFDGLDLVPPLMSRSLEVYTFSALLREW